MDDYLKAYYGNGVLPQPAMCPYCGKGPKYDMYENKMEHECTSPKHYWYAHGGQHLCMARWNHYCDHVKERKETGQA